MIDIVRVLRETTMGRAEHHPTLTSTNDRAAECAAQGVKDLPLLVVAEEQTAGRGRGVKRWWTGRGELVFSLLVDAKTVAAGETRSPLVALATAVAIADAVAPLLPNRKLGLRWPNDVVVDGKKLAGILVEVLPDRRHIIGIGVNTNNTSADAPQELRDVVATIRDLAGREQDQTDILIKLLHCLEQRYSQLQSDAKSVAAGADQLCQQRGQMVTLQWDDRKVAGRCRGIAADGSLLLETPTGVEAFCSGTVLPG